MPIEFTPAGSCTTSNDCLSNEDLGCEGNNMKVRTWWCEGGKCKSEPITAWDYNCASG